MSNNALSFGMGEPACRRGPKAEPPKGGGAQEGKATWKVAELSKEAEPLPYIYTRQDTQVYV